MDKLYLEIERQNILTCLVTALPVLKATAANDKNEAREMVHEMATLMKRVREIDKALSNEV
jgi:hypothetical protein